MRFDLERVPPMLDRLLANIDTVNPGAATMQVSAKTGEGVGEFREWLAGVPQRAEAIA